MADDTDPAVRIKHYPFPDYPSILCLLEMGSQGPQHSDKHSHPWAQINLMLDGRATWHTEDGSVEVRVGDAFLLLPGTPHHAEVRAGESCRTGTLEFAFGGEREPHASPGIPAPGFGGRPRSEAIRWLFEALPRRGWHHLRWDGFPEWWRRITREEQVAGGPYRALRLESALLEALSAFADPALAAPGGKGDQARMVERVQQYISEHLSTSALGVAELAEVAGMSRSRFTVRFTEQVGMSPHAYVNALRIWTAQTALAGSSSSLAEIAEQTRFSSPQHLSRAFKEATGMTPGEYRRRWAAPWLKKE
jgi:AraC-like DNA-binding protein